MDIQMLFNGKLIGTAQSVRTDDARYFPDEKNIVKNIADGEVIIDTFWDDTLVSTTTYSSDGIQISSDLEVGTELDIVAEIEEED